MTAESWNAGRKGQSVAVRSFPGRQTARKHTAKHFFDKKERWEQLSPVNPHPLAAKWREVSAQAKSAILDEATKIYENVIRRETEGENAVEVRAFLFKEPHALQAQESIGIVGKRGIFAAFKKDEVSVLRTSYRPLARTHKPPIRERDYLYGARSKLNDLLARSALLSKK